MNSHIFYTQPSSNVQKTKQKHHQIFDFGSHKEKMPDLLHGSEQYRYRCQMQLKTLIHQWLEYQKKLKSSQLSLSTSNLSLSHHPKAEYGLNETKFLYDQNDFTKENPLSSELINRLYTGHPIFKKINFNLADTLINIGVFSLYKNNHQIPFLFYDDKHKNKCNENKKLGFILYGKLKLYDKVNHYLKTIDHQDSIGEHGIQTLGINFTNFRNVKVTSIAQETAILWVSKHNYEILFKESMKCGLKEEIKKLEAHLKLSWIKKSVTKY